MGSELARIDEIALAAAHIEAVAGLMERAFGTVEGVVPEVYGGAALIGNEARRITELLASPGPP